MSMLRPSGEALLQDVQVRRCLSTRLIYEDRTARSPAHGRTDGPSRARRAGCSCPGRPARDSARTRHGRAAGRDRGFPVLRAITPPGVELLLVRHAVAHQSRPSRRPCASPRVLGLDRRVADDVEQLLVRPDVVLQRRDVEVADQHRAGRIVGFGAYRVHLGDEIELVLELPVDRPGSARRRRPGRRNYGAAAICRLPAKRTEICRQSWMSQKRRRSTISIGRRATVATP